MVCKLCQTAGSSKSKGDIRLFEVQTLPGLLDPRGSLGLASATISAAATAFSCPTPLACCAKTILYHILPCEGVATAK